ncbi:MAG: TonB-dependent receptor [Chitinophagaceae bacterium]|nr:TonB-dependent receptor [Chitinophagaceae bacterium]
MQHKLLAALLCALFSATGFAQISKTGKVTNTVDGAPLVGVSVTVKGSPGGTSTDDQGNFTITVPSNDATLVFSYTGFESKEVKASSSPTLNIALTSSQDALNEVVVIGYGTAKKSDLTGAVATVKADRLMDRPSPDVTQALQGRVPGVDVSINTSAPGEAAKVRIRGVTSINSSLDPLYVVDGVIGVAASVLNPNDIATIEVLKDASATAIYGARGANGVIIITTKRGIRGPAKISYDGYVGVNTLQRSLKALDAQGFMDVYNLAYRNAQKYDSLGFSQGKYVPNDPANFPELFDETGKPRYNTNWEKEVYKPAVMTNHYLNMQGGNDKTLYSLSLGYFNQDGLMIESWFKRYSARFTVDADVKDWLKVGGSVSLVKGTSRLVSDANGGLNVSRMVIEALPIIPVKYPDGTWGGNGDFPGMEGGSNPVNIAKNRYTLRNRQIAVGNVYAQINFTPDLNFKSDFGFSLNSMKNNFYSGRGLSSLSFDQKGVASIENWQDTYWQSENYLTWNKKINETHSMTALAGISFQKSYSENNWAEAQNFIDDFWGWHNLQAGSTIANPPRSGDNQWTMNSYFARLTYNIDDKYLFTATGRYDGSSKFGKNNKYAFFPSAGAAWRISQEDFMKNSRVFSELKVRASIGSTGNQEIGSYSSLQLLGSGVTILNGERQPIITRNEFGNPNLRWEKVDQYDIGLEMGFIDNRIQVAVDYFNKTTKDLLLEAPIPWTSGLETVFENVGSVRNVGFEAAFTSRNFIDPNFKWTTEFNFSTIRNEILQLGANNDDIYPGPWFLGETNVLRVGWPIGTFIGYEREGVWGTKDAAEAARYNLKPGDLKWKDVNEDGKIDDADIVRLGRAYPKYTMNLLNDFKIYNFDFKFDIRAVFGVNTVANFKHSTEDRQAIANSLATVKNAWTPDNQDSKIAEVRYYGSFYQTHIDSWWVEDGSFIRGQNIELGYTFPEKVLDRIGLTHLRVYGSAQNVFLISDYTGYDPEVLTFGGQLTQNQDFFPYPRPRTFNFGVNLSF